MPHWIWFVGSSSGFKLIFGVLEQGDTQIVMSAADLAITKSGSVNLELALHKVSYCCHVLQHGRLTLSDKCINVKLKIYIVLISFAKLELDWCICFRFLLVRDFKLPLVGWLMATPCAVLCLLGEKETVEKSVLVNIVYAWMQTTWSLLTDYVW